jgi:predicted site-specific integrase-resolvase
MKLPDYAKHLGISYKTAWRWWKSGKLPHPARQTETGMVIVDFKPEPKTLSAQDRAAIYARVSSSENRGNLDRQAERLTQYAMAKGYRIVHIVKEVGSGLNDNRKKLENLLMLSDYDILVVEDKDRLAIFGTHYLDVLLSRCGVKLEIVNLAEKGRDELMQDLISIITSFSARLYGQRRGKRKTESIIKQLQGGDEDEAS